MNSLSRKDIPYLLLSFFIPFICFILTKSHSLMFDDAAEFALVTKLGSIAHPPGTPAYVLTGFIWIKLAAIFGINIIDSLTILSTLFISISSLFLYCSFKLIASKLSHLTDIKNCVASCVSAVGFATASTSWNWANTVEVYGFQVLAISITLLGLVNFHFRRDNISLLIAAIGLSAGLGNHHLTMVLFLPFVPFFFVENIFIPTLKTDKKKKLKSFQAGFIKQFMNVFKMPAFWKLVGLSFLITGSFYLWMFIRIQNEYPFMFGKPDTFSEFIYHISGSTYLENINSGTQNIMGLRIPYFLKLTFVQLFVLFPFFIAGIAVMYKNKLFPLISMILGYFLLLFIYQINNNQWNNTDAYMLLPFTILYIGVFYGIIFFFDKIKAQFLLPLLIIFQIVYNFPDHDRRSYTVSDSLMKLLDKSSPKNSIIIISDWTLIIQYYFYRITENFRPDLVVLNNDIKFEHYRILPLMYPDFYKQIKPEYDDFINELMKENPHQAIGTGCDLTTTALVDKYKSLIGKIENISKLNNAYLLTDPEATYFFSSSNIYSPKFVSGCFSSSVAGDSISNNYFLNMDFDFLKSNLLLTDPSALNKLVDFRLMLDKYSEYYGIQKDFAMIEKTREAQNKINKIEREMKKRISFAFETK